jgi:thiol-disulfide isomerase/thioredoxin
MASSSRNNLSRSAGSTPFDEVPTAAVLAERSNRSEDIPAGNGLRGSPIDDDGGRVGAFDESKPKLFYSLEDSIMYDSLPRFVNSMRRQHAHDQGRRAATAGRVPLEILEGRALLTTIFETAVRESPLFTQIGRPNAAFPHVVDVTVKNFDRDVIGLSFKVPVVLYFWAPWCRPCGQLSPTLAKLASEYGGKFVLGKVDLNSESSLETKFDVRAVPSVFGMRAGKVVASFVGLEGDATIRSWLDNLLASPAK